jgi:hypothetical protein
MEEARSQRAKRVLGYFSPNLLQMPLRHDNDSLRLFLGDIDAHRPARQRSQFPSRFLRHAGARLLPAEKDPSSAILPANQPTVSALTPSRKNKSGRLLSKPAAVF